MSFLKKKSWPILFVVLVLAGCVAQATSPTPQASLQATPPATPLPTPPGDGSLSVALGVVKPARSAPLSLQTTGIIETVAIQAGDRVVAGDLLVQLDTTSLELARQAAQQEVHAQQAALDRAVAENAQQIARARIVLDVSQRELEQGQMQDPAFQVAAARARVKELQLQLDQAQAQNPAPEVAMARVGLTRAQSVRDSAQKEYQKALDRPWEPQEVRDGYANTLQQAEWDLQLAQAQLDGVLAAQQAHTVSLSVLAAQIEAAQAELDQAISARQAYTITLDIMAARVKTAQLELDSLQAQSELYQGERPTEARAHLQQAQLAVAEIERQMQQAQLRAPFDGTVVAVWVRSGEAIATGQPLVVVADLERFYVETTDLGEFDLARIDVGQPVTVSFDAFPDVTLTGHVSEIVLQALEDDAVTYAVRVALDELDPLPISLRWGMTGVVQITARLGQKE